MSLRDAGDEWQPGWLCVLPVSVCHSQCDRLVCVCVCVCVSVCLHAVLVEEGRAHEAAHQRRVALRRPRDRLLISPRISPHLPRSPLRRPRDRLLAAPPLNRSRHSCGPLPGPPRPPPTGLRRGAAPSRACKPHREERVRHEHGGRTTGERGSRARAPAAGPKSAPPWEGCSASQPSTLSGPPARTVEYSLMD